MKNLQVTLTNSSKSSTSATVTIGTLQDKMKHISHEAIPEVIEENTSEEINDESLEENTNDFSAAMATDSCPLQPRSSTEEVNESFWFQFAKPEKSYTIGQDVTCPRNACSAEFGI